MATTPRRGSTSRVFDTDRRIRLGIWGLGRGMSFYRTCAALNIDVVAGCDYNDHMRKSFLAHNPGAFVSADADEFLAQDFDAVLLATFCPAHAGDAIRCFRAGKHVLSEVTAFHTLAEGVALVEAAEKSGKVYNLAENYPWTPVNMWLARKWKEGLFGELMYAEYEYVHECRSLAYTYIDGKPVQPGNQVHSWRSWLNFHYYNTHSLGPVMVITGTRPVKTAALMGTQRLAGYPSGDSRGMGAAAPSLTTMNNGGLVRNLMGATTNDSHQQRLWGTLGAAQIGAQGLQLRLGASGHAPMYRVNPTLDALGQRAAGSGHGGGDFWVLYYFARQILTGERAPWDTYASADVTIQGIQAYRSTLQEGQALDCPDFRDPAQRDKYRNDDWRQEHLDPRTWAFPAHAEINITGQFSKVMTDLIRATTTARACLDWLKVADDAVFDSSILSTLDGFISDYPKTLEIYRAARALMEAYPTANAARVLREMLEVGCEELVLSPTFLPGLKKQRNALRKTVDAPQAGPAWLEKYEVSSLLPKCGDIRKAALPGKTIKFRPATYVGAHHYADVRDAHQGKDGLVYVRGAVSQRKGGKGTLVFGADGPVRVWLNGKPVGCEPKATNPVQEPLYRVSVTWKKGRNQVVFALNTNRAQAWGVTAAVAQD